MRETRQEMAMGAPAKLLGEVGLRDRWHGAAMGKDAPNERSVLRAGRHSGATGSLEAVGSQVALAPLRFLYVLVPFCQRWLVSLPSLLAV